jgi:hypothetical protein
MVVLNNRSLDLKVVGKEQLTNIGLKNVALFDREAKVTRASNTMGSTEDQIFTYVRTSKRLNSERGGVFYRKEEVI